MTAQAPSRPLVGFTCAYSPPALIHAASFTAYRILPVGDAPDAAGGILHDNLCPQVKRLLDRVLADDLPALSGVVIAYSCDAMRRLSDALHHVRPELPQIGLDLPPTSDEAAVRFYAGQLRDLVRELAAWAGTEVDDDDVRTSVGRYDELVTALDDRVATLLRRGASSAAQALRSRSVTQPPEQTMAELARQPDAPSTARDGVPVYLFGNVLPDPEAFTMLAESGCRVVGDELCTGSKQLVRVGLRATDEDPFLAVARALLGRPPCARTFDASRPLDLARQVAERATATGARGVVAHVMKFCDPYLARMPAIRRALRKAGLPLLVLEGDCSLKSLGQHQTRIEAFAEMIQETAV